MSAKESRSREIALLLPSLGGGGAERAALNLVPGLRHHAYEPLLVLQQATGELLDEVPADVPVISLESRRTLQSLLPLTRFLRKRRPAGLVSFLGPTNIVAIWARALARVDARLAITQHSALSLQSREVRHWQQSRLPLFYRAFAREADAIVAVSNGVADDLAATAHLPRGRIQAIYNPVVTDDFLARLSRPTPEPGPASPAAPTFVAVARLAPEKDHATLLSAFALYRERQPGRLLLVGDGPLRAELERRCAALGLSEAVEFLGFRKDPLPYIRSATALVLSSRWEGFGNVLVEGLAAGVPVISTDCPFGPREILAGGEFGQLVPVGDAAALAAAMERVLREPGDPGPGRQRARLFASEVVAAAYLDALDLPSGGVAA